MVDSKTIRNDICITDENRWALNYLGGTFAVKLTDCITDADISTANISSQFIVFRKPDGTTFEKTATLEEFPASSGKFFITYVNESPEESILDLIGNWEYGARVVTTDAIDHPTAKNIVFWVE